MNRSTIDLWVGVFVVARHRRRCCSSRSRSATSRTLLASTQTYQRAGAVRQHRRPQGAGAGQERGRGGRPRRRHPLRQRDATRRWSRWSSTRTTSSRSDTTAKILTSGLLGEQYVGLEAGGDGEMLKTATASAHPVGGGAREPDQPVPVQQGGRRQGREEVKCARAFVSHAGAAACAALGGCATPRRRRDPRDPLEGFNRGSSASTRRSTSASAKPVATGYRERACTSEIRDRVRNFFGNIGDVWIGVNNVLQGKFVDGFERLGALRLQHHLGIFGMHDVASDMGIEKHDEDFGQTLGRWGVGAGPYLVLPVLGSSTLRDGSRQGVDFFADPLDEFRPDRAAQFRVRSASRATGAPTCSTRAGSSSRPRSTSTCSSATRTCSAAAA